MASNNVKELTDATFAAEIGEGVVVVDFWAEWCGPCRMVGPIFEQLAGEYEGRARFGKINVDPNPQVPAKVGIRSLPTVIVFKDGKEVERIVGAFPKPKLAQAIDAHL